MERRRVVAHGLVQGLFFRDTLREAALRHGAQDDVERLVEAARRGPRSAQVERLEVWEEPVEGVSGFSIVG